MKGSDRSPGTRHQLSGTQQQQRKQSLLTRSVASEARSSIAHAVVIKDEDLFLVTDDDGKVPIDGNHGFGLYYHDCRYLNGYQLTLAGQPLDLLVGTATRGFSATFELTNPDIDLPSGSFARRQMLILKWERIIDANKLALEERLTITNFGDHRVDLPLEIKLRA